MANQLLDLEKCTGCELCSTICPKNAIDIMIGDNGFYEPVINYEKCINCYLCSKKCPNNYSITLQNVFETKVYACWNKNNVIRLSSTSGGVFFELGKKIIEQEGIVIGAQYDENLRIEHGYATNIDELEKLKQSKYAQSRINNIFKFVKNNIDTKKILFSGTPCQCNALVNYLGKKPDNLILSDFICRGINSPLVYEEYIHYLENRYNSKVSNISFKNKKYGWNNFCTRIIFTNGKKVYIDRYEDLFMRGYLEGNLFMRKSCSDCKYRTFPHKYSDITLADFWGVEKSLDNDMGTSLVIINTTKGDELFDDIDTLEKNISSIDDALDGNSCLLESPIMNNYSEDFFKSLKQFGLKKSINKYTHTSPIWKVKKVIYRIKRRSKYE